MQQSKAYVIKRATRNLKATVGAHKARGLRAKRIATLRALELVTYRRFDR